MALCPYCSEEIKEDSTKCEHCGHILKFSSELLENANSEETKKIRLKEVLIFLFFKLPLYALPLYPAILFFILSPHCTNIFCSKIIPIVLLFYVGLWTISILVVFLAKIYEGIKIWLGEGEFWDDDDYF